MMNKHVIFERLAASLQKFSPEIGDNWLCPTCLRVIPRSQPNEVTEVHIVPQAAGGGIATVLCRRCNSQFGAHQDRWLGEFLRMLRSNQPFPFSPPTRSNFFEIDGARVGGTYDIQPDTGVRFIMDSERTNPETLKAVLRSSLIAILSRRLPQQTPEMLTVSLPIPILGRKALIEVGF
jgi:HNH endonuclease